MGRCSLLLALGAAGLASGGCGGGASPSREDSAGSAVPGIARSEVAPGAVADPTVPGPSRPAPLRIVAPTFAWLRAHQADDGRWSATEPGRSCDGNVLATPSVDGGGSPDGDVGATGLVVFAFLSAGFTHRSDGPEGAAVMRALRWLRSVQHEDGTFGARPLAGGLADQAIAARAWVELHGMTGSVVHLPISQRAVRAVLAARRPDGTWGRDDASSAADPRATAWGLRVLVAAGVVDRAERQVGRPPPYGLDDDVRASVLRLLEDEATPVDVATRAQLRIAVGIPRATDDGFRRALKETARLVPTAEAVRQDLEGWWARFALHRAVGHAPDEAWERALFDAIAHLPRRDGEVCGARGSVDPDACARGGGGRVASTAMAVLLESLCWTCYPSELRWLPTETAPGTDDGSK